MQLNDKLDSIILTTDATSADVHRVATHAMQHGLRAIVTGPVWTARLATMLRGSGVRVCAVVAYPLGLSKPTVKAIEATSTLKDGADEIEITPHLAAMLALDLDGARAELLEIVRAARATRRDAFIRVAIDVARLLRDEEKGRRAMEVAARAVRESGCDGVVVPGVSDATRFKPHAESLQLKAVVSTAAEARAALAGGAEIVGSSAAAGIMEENG